MLIGLWNILKLPFCRFYVLVVRLMTQSIVISIADDSLLGSRILHPQSDRAFIISWFLFIFAIQRNKTKSGRSRASLSHCVLNNQWIIGLSHSTCLCVIALQRKAKSNTLKLQPRNGLSESNCEVEIWQLEEWESARVLTSEDGSQPWRPWRAGRSSDPESARRAFPVREQIS